MFILQEPASNPNGYAVLNTLIGTLGPILATVVTYLLTRKHVNRTEAAAAEAASKAAEQKETLGQVHVLVNGRLSAALAENEALKARVAALEAGTQEKSVG